MIVDRVFGDILQSKCQTLVCPVNTLGAMGAGLAKQFKVKYPEMVKPYQLACKHGVFGREGILIYEHHSGTKVLCLPSKRDWRLPSNKRWIEHAFFIIARDWQECGITSLALPPVGCGLGGLEWEYDVEPLVDKYFAESKLPVTLYFPKEWKKLEIFSDSGRA